MCGICGKLYLNNDAPPMDPKLLQRMTAVIAHRGPDEDGIYVSGRVGLGNRRLKIIDLSTGHQPISNEDGSIWIVYNGETYNYRELRSFLVSRGHKFRTATDTEVIVHLYEEFGDDFVQKLWGMFSLALWDEKKRKLLIARDRVGIKPLYYTLTPQALIFGSEIKSILVDPTVKVVPDPTVLDRFLTYLYVPGTETLFGGISKLPPGHYMVVRGAKVDIRQYWDLPLPTPGAHHHAEEDAESLANLLADVVRDHMIADVPVGILLSGGVDSSAMLSFAVEQTGKQINTFTVGFEGQTFADERPYARLAAERFGARHFETTIDAKDFLECLPRFIWHMEEPVCEPPAIALYFVTKLARQHVTVLLSGEGGDEAFAGYQNYRNLFWLEKIKSALGPFARPISRTSSVIARIHNTGRWRRYATLMGMSFEDYYLSRTAEPSQGFDRIKDSLYTPDFRQKLPLNGRGAASLARAILESTRGCDTLSRMLYLDSKTWLPDDLLIKADKMTMANSVELRVPLLDHRVLEFAARLPRSSKLRGLTTKYILKKALASRVPRPILKRRKTGFPVPYEGWIRNELGNYVREVLTDRRSLERGYFQQKTVETLVEENVRQGRHSKELFSLLILELWHRTFLDRVSQNGVQWC